MTENKRVLTLFVVAVLVYVNSLWNAFTYDDYFYIHWSPTVRTGSVSALAHATKLNTIFRPLTFSTFALNWAASGPHAFSYHLINVLLHAAVTILLYLVLLRLLEARPAAASIAFVAALIFAVHPIHTEAVASITGRSDLLAMAFLLLGWLLHLEDRLIPALFCFLLAMLSKESAVVFLPLVVAGDLAQGKLRSIVRYVWMGATTGVYLVLLWIGDSRHFGPKNIVFVDNPLASLPVFLRIPNALRVGWKYVGLQFFPYKLSCDYSYNAIHVYSDWRHALLAVFASLVVLALWLWTFWSGRKAWFLAGAIYLVGFGITANLLVPTGTIMGERLAYLPSAGFCLLLALIWALLQKGHANLAWAVLVIVLMALGARTVVRNPVWHDNLTLFSTDVHTVPGSARAHILLGVEYMTRNQGDAALAEFKTGLQIFPDYPTGVEDYGLIESRLGHDQEALRFLTRAVSVCSLDAPDYDFMRVNLAVQQIKLGQDDEALNLLNQIIADAPQYSRAWYNRAVIRYRRGELGLAKADAETAVRLDSSNRQAQSLLSAVSTAAASR